jgi:LysM repeat protein
MKDHQVMTQALKAEAQHGQRTIADLQMERQALQRELGTERTAKGRLEGDLLNAERRLLESRHIVDLQREELARAGEERERLVQTTRQVQSELTEVSRLRQQLADTESERARLRIMEEAVTRQAKELTELKSVVRQSLRAPALKADMMAPASKPSAILTPAVAYSEAEAFEQKTIRVRPGDSLWKLARRYGIALDELKALNALKSDVIVPGQQLLIPDSSRP